MTRRLAGGLCASLLVLLAAALTPSVSAASAQAPAPASITDATTGLSDAATVAPVDACPPPSSFRATCLAQILGVRGTTALVHPRLRRPASPYRIQRPRARGSHVATAAVAAADAPQAGTPAYLQEAYDLTSLSELEGTNATVAIVDAYDDPTAESDLATYRAKFGLPPCTSANGCFTKLNQNGEAFNYPTTVDSGWELESSLDLDAVSALCPNCNIDLVEADSPGSASTGFSDIATAQATAGAQPGVDVISDSWDVPLSGRADAHDFMSYGPYTFQGITTVAASGDSGYLAGTSDFPAALSSVTAAGGTSLQPASASGIQSVRGFTESAWSLAGSGCNTGTRKPNWQTDTGCTGRSYSDISADADPDTGMQVYDTAGGGWLVAGGTSEASPLIAAYYALLDSAAEGPQPLLASAPEGPSWAWANASLLNDPTSGQNGTCSASIAYICDTGPGYDGPTGVGSISGAVVDGAPGITGPGTNGSYAQTVTTESADLHGGVYPNGEDTTYWWQYGTTTAYGQEAQANDNDIGSGTDPVQVADTLTGLSPGTTYHFRLVAQNSLGTSYGYDYTLTTPATITSSPTQNQNQPTTQSPPTTTVTSTPPVTGSGGSGGSGTSTSPTGPPLVTKVELSPAARAATISATIAGRGGATTYALQYGTTSALGRTGPGSGSLASSQATATVGWTLHNLSPGKIYYVRAVATNERGTTRGAVIRFRTSPVTITRVITRGNQLQLVLRCHGASRCRFRLQGRYGNRVMLSSQATIRGNRSANVTLTLTRAFETLATNRRTAKLLVLSTWNGVTATVGTTI